MARASGQFPVAHGSEFAAHGLRGDHDAELLQDPSTQIDKPPADDFMDCWDRSILDDRHKGRALRIVQSRWLARGLTVNEPTCTHCIELQHPIAHDLQRHPTDLGRFSARRAIIDGGQGQKATRLSTILGLPGLSPQPGCIVVVSQRRGHGEPLPFASPRIRTHSRRSSPLSRLHQELVLTIPGTSSRILIRPSWMIRRFTNATSSGSRKPAESFVHIFPKTCTWRRQRGVGKTEII